MTNAIDGGDNNIQTVQMSKTLSTKSIRDELCTNAGTGRGKGDCAIVKSVAVQCIVTVQSIVQWNGVQGKIKFSPFSNMSPAYHNLICSIHNVF